MVSLEAPGSCDAAVGGSDAAAAALDSSPGSDGSTGPGPLDSAPTPIDSATGTGASFSVSNPSFETSGGTVPMQTPPYWQLCPNFNVFPLPDASVSLPAWPLFSVINPGVCSMMANDGSNYLGLTAGSYGPADASESVGTRLGAPLQAGTTYSVSVDLAMAVKSPIGASNQPAVLEVWGSKTGCTKDERLWTSQTITNSDMWKPYCGFFRPTQPWTYLTLTPAAPSGTFAMGQWSYVVVDHLVPGATCK
jgi:hypothetical protein